MATKFKFETNPDFLRRLERLKAAQDVPLPELLPPAFMETHTRFRDIDAMVAASPVAGLFETDPKAAWDSEEWRAFVVETTKFDTFEAFLGAAAAEHVKRRWNS